MRAGIGHDELIDGRAVDLHVEATGRGVRRDGDRLPLANSAAAVGEVEIRSLRDRRRDVANHEREAAAMHGHGRHTVLDRRDARRADRQHSGRR